MTKRKAQINFKCQISKQVLNLGFLALFGIFNFEFGILTQGSYLNFTPLPVPLARALTVPERCRVVAPVGSAHTSVHGIDEWQCERGGAGQYHSEAASRVVTGFPSETIANDTISQEGMVYMAGLETTQVRSSVVRRQVVTNIVTPNDPDFPQQDYLHAIRAQEAWAYANAAEDVVVAVIDSGVDIDHPDLIKNIWQNPNEIAGNGIDDDGNGYVDDVQGWDFVRGMGDPRPKFDQPYNKLGIIHGTVVAGVLGARGNNDTGIAGVAWRVKIMPLRVLNGMGEGTTSNVAAAIDYARKMGARVINLSFVGHDSSLSMTEAIQSAWKEGILVVAAAGNEVREGINLDITPAYPVCQNGPNGQNWVFGVTSVDLADRRASFSNYGRTCVDAAAPGVSVYSTVVFRPTMEGFDRPYSGWWTGTSVAAPQISGTAALLWSMKPSLSLGQIHDLLSEYGRDIDNINSEIGGLLGRRLDLYETLRQASITEERPSLIGRPETAPARAYIVTAPLAGHAPEVRVYDDKAIMTHSFFAFPHGYRAGVNISTGDLDGDGEIEVVASARKGAAPQVHVYALNGKRKSSFLAYHPNFSGGVSTAVGDADGDGMKDIITVPMAGGGPHVRVFSMDGTLRSQFFAFDEGIRGGLSVTTGDIDADGTDEIIVGSGPGMPATVRIFRADGTLRRELVVFPASFKGGISVAAVDLDSNGTDEIVVGAGKGGGPQVRVFTPDGEVYLQFFAFRESFHGGITVSVGDVNHDGREELLIAAGSGGGSQVAVYNKEGNVLSRFNAFEAGYVQGVNVASGD